MPKEFAPTPPEVSPAPFSEALKTFQIEGSSEQDASWRIEIDKLRINSHHGFDYVLTMMMGMKGMGLIDDTQVQSMIDRMFDNDNFHNFNDSSKKSKKFITEADHNLNNILKKENIRNISLENLTERRERGVLEHRLKAELEKGSPVAFATEGACALLLPNLFEDKKAHSGTVLRAELVSPFPLPVPLDTGIMGTENKFQLSNLPDTAQGIHFKISIKKIANIIERSGGRAVAIRATENIASDPIADL